MCTYINGLVQDCTNTITNALGFLKSCTKPSICSKWKTRHGITGNEIVYRNSIMSKDHLEQAGDFDLLILYSLVYFVINITSQTLFSFGINQHPQNGIPHIAAMVSLMDDTRGAQKGNAAFIAWICQSNCIKVSSSNIHFLIWIIIKSATISLTGKIS